MDLQSLKAKLYHDKLYLARHDEMIRLESAAERIVSNDIRFLNNKPIQG